MQNEPGDRQVGGYKDRQDGHESVFVRDSRDLGPDKGSSVQNVQMLALLIDWNTFDPSWESHSEILVAVSHQLDPLRDRKRNASKDMQSMRHLGQGGEICFAKP